MNFSGSENSLFPIQRNGNNLKNSLSILSIYGILVLPIFMIYSKVYKLNKSRDQETAVFQIIDHFHEINKKLTIAFWGVVALEIMLYCLDYLTLFYFLILGSLFLFACVSEVNQFLLGLLAVQRFLLYFYPRTEKYLNFSKRTVNWILVIAYACSFLVGIYLLKTIAEKDLPQFSINDNFPVSYYVYNLSLQAFLTASAALYIPIVISISKLMNLASAKINKPQKFVAWQLVVVVVKQMIFISYALYGALDDEDEPFLQIPAAIESSKFFDALLMPTITQITYLGCNRRNEMAFLKTVKPKWLFRNSRSVGSDARVQYVERVETTL